MDGVLDRWLGFMGSVLFRGNAVLSLRMMMMMMMLHAHMSCSAHGCRHDSAIDQSDRSQSGSSRIDLGFLSFLLLLLLWRLVLVVRIIVRREQASRFLCLVQNLEQLTLLPWTLLQIDAEEDITKLFNNGELGYAVGLEMVDDDVYGDHRTKFKLYIDSNYMPTTSNLVTDKASCRPFYSMIDNVKLEPGEAGGVWARWVQLRLESIHYMTRYGCVLPACLLACLLACYSPPDRRKGKA